jgi:hypothetical protein
MMTANHPENQADHDQAGADLRGEERIVWVRDITALDYVRSSVSDEPDRQGPPRFCRGKNRKDFLLVGHAEVSKEARSNYGTYRRRVFWLRRHDRQDQAYGCYRAGCPREAVDPATVAVGVPGILTNRAWYGRAHPRLVAHPELADRKVRADELPEETKS